MIDIGNINIKEIIEAETLEIFNRNNYIKCPFHNEKTPSLKIRFDSNANKYKFKCFGCGEGGDAIDFIMKYKNMSYNEAREYLGLEVEKTDQEKEIDLLKSYLDNQIKDFKHNYKVLGIFPFANEEGKVIYYKVKFLKPNGKKETPYYRTENGKVYNSRGETGEIPYNLYGALKGIKEGKTLIIVEGEKDVNTINNILRSSRYVATSVKNCKNLDMYSYSKICVIGDTGAAGGKYIQEVKDKLYQTATMFKIVKLKGLERLGDNKDVTDWLEAGNTKEDLINSINRSLDLKNILELQQDYRGIYKHVIKGEGEPVRIDIADFQVVSACRVSIVDKEEEGIKLILKSFTGHIYERVDLVNVFDDVRTFKNFLGSMDLNFYGKGDDLTKLCSWINRFFAIENEISVSGVKFKEIDNKLNLITQAGSLNNEGFTDLIKADETNNINIVGVDPINREELQDLYNNLMSVMAKEKIISILGTVFNNLMVHQAETNGIKLHHLLIVGESGSGKSTVLSDVIAPILNYPRSDIKSIGLITQFGLIQDLSSGNYTSLFDEFKPSSLDYNKISKLSEILRNLYDRSVTVRGNKSLKVRKFRSERPIIIAGEESYPNSEKALVERSCIIYISKAERTQESTKAVKWIIRNKSLLNKLGRALIDEVLKLSNEDYLKIRDKVETNFKDLTNRFLNTGVNIAAGIELFNKVLLNNGLEDLIIKDHEKLIEYNIKEESLSNGNEAYSTVELMIKLFDDLVANNKIENINQVITFKNGVLFIKTSELINSIHLFVRTYGSAEVVPLKASDFKKQATKAGYMLKDVKEQIKVSNGNETKRVRFEGYNLEKFKELKCFNILELIEDRIKRETEIEVDMDAKVVQGYFN